MLCNVRALSWAALMVFQMKNNYFVMVIISQGDSS